MNDTDWRELVAVARRIGRASEAGDEPNPNDLRRLAELVVATDVYEEPDRVPAHLNGRPVVGQVQVRPTEWLILVDDGEKGYASAWWLPQLGTTWQWAHYLPNVDLGRALRAYFDRVPTEAS
jgi:hypothetical protein